MIFFVLVPQLCSQGVRDLKVVREMWKIRKTLKIPAYEKMVLDLS